MKFVSVLLFSLFIVDFIGRRRSLITGICLQIVTLAFIGAYLGATNGLSASYIKSHAAAEHASTAAIVAIFLHAVAWSIGWFSAPYLINSEIFPIRIRSLNMSILMAFHWAYYFGCSRAMPSLLAATHRYGAFVFFGCICLVSLVFVFFCMPVSLQRSTMMPTDGHRKLLGGHLSLLIHYSNVLCTRSGRLRIQQKRKFYRLEGKMKKSSLKRTVLKRRKW